MRICILTTSFPLKKGDLSGIFILEQGRHLVKQGIKVSVIAPHHPRAPQHEEIDGIRVHRFRYFLPESLQKLCYGSGIPNNLQESLLAKIQLPFLLLTFTIQAIRHARDCDIIHAHWSPAGFAGLIASKILGKPVILTMHHGTNRVLTKTEKFIMEQVDYVLCNSTFTLLNVSKTAMPKKVKVIPPGVDTQTFRPLADNSINMDLLPDISRNRSIIFTVGRLIELKGHKYLIEALSLLNEDTLFHLLIGGEGPLRQVLENQAKDIGLTDRVTFLGHIPNHLIPFYYPLADVYVQPSIIDKDGNTEGLGIALLEAMACETPCVGSRAGGITDIISDGKNGFLVDAASPVQLAEKISLLLQDKELRLKMGKEGRVFVEQNFSWSAKTRDLMEIYNIILHRS